VKTLLLIGYLFLYAFTAYSNDQVEKLSSYDSNVLKDLTARWNNCLVKKDLQTLATLYADQQYKVSFPKNSSFNVKSNDVQGYLIFNMVSGNWKIVTESDDVTDKNRLLKGTVKEKNATKTCIDVVTQILLTSPTYLERTKCLNNAVVKNGGTSIGITLEGSPHPDKDDAQEYSKTYDFNLHETFSERMTVIERFSFNPEDKQLYMINAIEDILNPIDFDRSLLLKFDVLCK
jgi:hypothetical protein